LRPDKAVWFALAKLKLDSFSGDRALSSEYETSKTEPAFLPTIDFLKSS